MLLYRSLRRKLLATVLTAAALVLVYEATVIDSRSVPVQAAAGPGLVAGSRAEFVATAYCKGTTTQSGVNVKAGMLAADPNVLPIGSVVQLEGPDAYEGIYAVMDTGPTVKGRHVDMYIWSCYEALDFGRRPVTLTVLRLGWSPKNSGGVN
jgi:3D (Asp-Asp-Asp) domain-containing protein